MDGQLQILDDKTRTLAELVTTLTDSEPLDRVQLLRMISETAQSALRQAVPEAHHAGASWSQLGEALAMTKQGAWVQYG